MTHHLTLLVFLLIGFFGSLHARSGQATYYNPSVGIGACGFQNSDNEMVCAMAAADFDPRTPGGNPNRNPLCGRTVTVAGPKGKVTLRIVDRCPGSHCKSGDLDVSPAAFDILSGNRDLGRIRIKWNLNK